MATEDIDLDEVYQALLTAQKDYRAAVDEANRARSQETAAINRLSAAQRDFDETIAKVKGRAAVAGTDWARKDVYISE